MNVHAHVILVLLAFCSCAWASKLSLEKKILDDIFTNYDSRIRPIGMNGTGPVIVEINAYLGGLFDLDDSKMQCTAQLIFWQKWFDERLKYNSSQGLKYLTLSYYGSLWTPDLFFTKEKKGHFHNIVAPNNFIRIYPDGHVLFSIRISLDLFCPMDLRNYPMDNQECTIPVASYGYTTNDLVLRWKDVHPLQLSSNIHLPKFSFSKYYTENCTSKTITGEYSCVAVKLFLSRDFKFYMRHVFIPTMLLVILSWLTFWLHPRSMGIRLGILIVTLVIIVTISVTECGPRVTYNRAIDIWMDTCICFIFSVLIEMALVNNAIAQDDSRKRQMTKEDDEKKDVDDGVKTDRNLLSKYTAVPLRWLNKYPTLAQRIDVVSRFLFPVVFVIFNCVFWLTYAVK